MQALDHEELDWIFDRYTHDDHSLSVLPRYPDEIKRTLIWFPEMGSNPSEHLNYFRAKQMTPLDPNTKARILYATCTKVG